MHLDVKELDCLKDSEILKQKIDEIMLLLKEKCTVLETSDFTLENDILTFSLALSVDPKK